VNTKETLRPKSSLLSEFRSTLENFFFRFLSRYFSPKWFLSKVPQGDEITPYTGRLSLEIVSHCWNYSHLLAYNLSSFVNHPPTQIDVTVTVFFSPEDPNTVTMLDFFAAYDIPGVTWNWQPVATAQLLRRAIGRNKAALETTANWKWYLDCDLIFKGGCLDSLAHTLSGRTDALLFPKSEFITSLLPEDNPILKNGHIPTVLDIDTNKFHPNPITRAVGAYQITHGDVARACGYCNNIRVYQTPTMHWRKTYEDRTYRWLLRTQGSEIDIPNIYRIRHIAKGRYNSGTLRSKLRSFIRVNESRLKEKKQDYNPD
jgi:hypothetical protein